MSDKPVVRADLRARKALIYFRNNWQLYFLLLIPITFVIVFKYAAYPKETADFDCLAPEDIRELDQYCRDRFIDHSSVHEHNSSAAYKAVKEKRQDDGRGNFYEK